MNFTPWTLLVDIGLVSLLLLVGKFLRSKVKFIQRLFIPPSLLAGFAGLVLGPEVLGWLPLSGQLGTYAGILIALVFSCIPLTSAKATSKGESRVGRMWAYSQAGMLLQWALGGALGLWVLSLFWPLNGAFGLSMPAGFCGGHGTAAAIGEAFSRYGVEEMLSLSMTSATVGIIASVVIGMWIITWGASRGKAAFLARFESLPPELRTGILPKDKRSSMGMASFSAISLDSMTFNFAMVALTALAGYGISELIAMVWPVLKLPVFSCAFIAGLGVSWFLKRVKVDEHLSRPIIVLLTVGLLFTALYVFWVGARIHKDYSFEKSIFTWGWFTGTMAMGIALLRITDPDSKSGCLDDYALAYLYIAPVEIALVSLSPVAFAYGWGWLFVTVCAVAGVSVLGFAAFRGWFRK